MFLKKMLCTTFYEFFRQTFSVLKKMLQQKILMSNSFSKGASMNNVDKQGEGVNQTSKIHKIM